jgi:hypothetical protein
MILLGDDLRTDMVYYNGEPCFVVLEDKILVNNISLYFNSQQFLKSHNPKNLHYPSTILINGKPYTPHIEFLVDWVTYSLSTIKRHNHYEVCKLDVWFTPVPSESHSQVDPS